ncbi:hypothetical protein FOS14_23710 [Skermania sp. ID1734]|uniref:PIG-L family deacetylase n=1 Tax=Skermania sp. ID1734 TaxID=2597516 RepID=UPI00117F5F3A|nr:PIG-L family deacetylase [Skermania sp. ID1734]TSD93130.1 hypothetical protein FOS14_23710 [Skermania sp. ID1734]
MRRLVVSPHLDDAVLSAFSALSSEEVTVVTVFAGIPDVGIPLSSWDLACGVTTSPADHTRQRRSEDEAALAVAGASVVHLDFIDDQYREGATPYLEISAALADLAEGYDEVWFPAAFGGHPDHRATAVAALTLNGPYKRIMYADIPYIIPELERAGIEQGLKFGSEESLEILLSASPFTPPTPPTAVSLPPDLLYQKRIATEKYATQIDVLRKSFPQWVTDSPLFSYEWHWEIPRTSNHAWPIRPRPVPEPGPQLSVLVATPENTTEWVDQVLGALACQSDRDFEVIVAPYGPATAIRDRIRSSVAGSPEWLASQVEVADRAPIETLGQALNTGLRLARGSYLNVLLPGDTPAENHVSEFSRLAGTGDSVRLLQTGGDPVDEGLDSSAAIDDALLRCAAAEPHPLARFAMPRLLMRDLGLGFDEQLNRFTDWDLLLRIHRLVDVSKSTQTTVQRDTAEDKPVHGASQEESAERRATARRIAEKLNATPMVISPGAARIMRERLHMEAHVRSAFRHVETSLRAALENESTQRSALSEQLAAATALISELQATDTAQISELQKQLAEQQTAVRDLTTRLQHSETTVEAITNSTSWRMTKPLRSAKRKLSETEQ